jgi:hypothetical protein
MKHLATIIAVIELIEAFADESVKGENKKALAMDILVKTFAKMGITLNGKIIRGVSEIIDTAVELFNIFGWKQMVHRTLGGLFDESEFGEALKQLERVADGA